MSHYEHIGACNADLVIDEDRARGAVEAKIAVGTTSGDDKAILVTAGRTDRPRPQFNLVLERPDAEELLVLLAKAITAAGGCVVLREHQIAPSSEGEPS